MVETIVNRPIEETDKIIDAAFNRALEYRGKPADLTTSLITLARTEEKAIEFAWEKWCDGQNMLGVVSIKILERHLEVWATLRGLISKESRKYGMIRGLVGTARLPIFTNSLEVSIGEAFDLVQAWRQHDLVDHEINPSFGYMLSSKPRTNKDIKDFVDGI